MSVPSLDPSTPAYFDRLPDPPILRANSFREARVSFKAVEEYLQPFLLETGIDKSNFRFLGLSSLASSLWPVNGHRGHSVS